MAKYDFFISYSTKDKDIASKIVDVIESTGHTCWIAPRNIPYGTPYARAIMEGIDECEKFIVLITNNSIKSEDVLNEVDNAHAIKRMIIPVRLTETQLPRELNYYLSRTQWLSIDTKNLNEIVNSLCLTNKQPDIQEYKLPQETKDKKEVKSKIDDSTADNKSTLNDNKNKGDSTRDNTREGKNIIIPALRSLRKGRLLGSLLIVLSLSWLIFAYTDRHPDDTLLLIAFIASLILVVLMTIGLFKPIKLGFPSRKECLIFVGLPGLLFLIIGAAYTETNIQSDIHANSIMDSSNDSMTDSVTVSDRISSIQQLGDEAYNKQDYEVAVKHYQEMSDDDNPYGHYMLGKCHYSGLGVKKDLKVAFELFSKGAQGNMVNAINSLGVCYLKGRGTKQDFGKAAECFKAAAEQGLSIAQANLADCYVYGNGVEQNYVTAKDWYEKAANQEYAPAAFNIGRLYYNGRPGIGLNYEKAAQWYRKAAVLGLAEAQNSIGVCYLKGQGVERNMKEAFKWFEKAASQGNTSGLYNLANCYRDGNGVQKDKEQAKRLYKEAADKGSSTARAALKRL